MRYAEQWRTRCAFLMIDLDRFKAVNDSLGHQLGDQLLAQVSQRLAGADDRERACAAGWAATNSPSSSATPRDTGRVDRLAASDHRRAFAALRCRPSHAVHRRQRRLGDRAARRRSVETLMRNADLALYRAKDEGGGDHCTLRALAPRRRRRAPPARILAAPGASSKNELELNFQPVVDARSETVVSFEALLRWNSEEHGFVSPAQVHPAGRGYAPDRADRRMGPARGLPRGGAAGPTTSRSRSTSRASSCSSPISPAPWSARWPTAAFPPTGSRSR